MLFKYAHDASAYAYYISLVRVILEMKN